MNSIINIKKYIIKNIISPIKVEGKKYINININIYILGLLLSSANLDIININILLLVVAKNIGYLNNNINNNLNYYYILNHNLIILEFGLISVYGYNYVPANPLVTAIPLLGLFSYILIGYSLGILLFIYIDFIRCIYEFVFMVSGYLIIYLVALYFIYSKKGIGISLYELINIILLGLSAIIIHILLTFITFPLLGIILILTLSNNLFISFTNGFTGLLYYSIFPSIISSYNFFILLIRIYLMVFNGSIILLSSAISLIISTIVFIWYIVYHSINTYI